MRIAKIGTIMHLSAALAFSKDKVQLPQQAPLPDRVLVARTIYLTSDADRIAYDEAYKQIHDWGRFQLTTDPDKVDLVWMLRTDYINREGGSTYRRSQSLTIFDRRPSWNFGARDNCKGAPSKKEIVRKKVCWQLMQCSNAFGTEFRRSN